jgi:hypothetical protein
VTIQFEKLKARLLANPKVKAEYDALAPEFEIASELLRARLRAGLSQAELAARMGTSQSTIARFEKWSDASEHQDAAALRQGNRQQDERAPVGGLIGRHFASNPSDAVKTPPYKRYASGKEESVKSGVDHDRRHKGEKCWQQAIRPPPWLA